MKKTVKGLQAHFMKGYWLSYIINPCPKNWNDDLKSPRSHRRHHFVNIDKYRRSAESLLPHTETHPHTPKTGMYGFFDVNELPEQTGRTAEIGTAGKKKIPCKLYPARDLWW